MQNPGYLSVIYRFGHHSDKSLFYTTAILSIVRFLGGGISQLTPQKHGLRGTRRRSTVSSGL
jgi:hypothetical protein